MNTIIKTLLPVATTLAMCMPAHALELEIQEGAELPPGLKWQKVSITSRHKSGSNFGSITPQQQNYLYNLWKSEIEAKDKKANEICGLPRNSGHECSFPENILFAEIELNGAIHRFSSASMEYEGCNTGYINDVIKCEWIYENINKKTGDITLSKKISMCANTEPSIEFAIGDKNKIYFSINQDSGLYNLADFCATSIEIK